MSQIAQYYNSFPRREYHYKKRSNVGKTSAPSPQTEMKHRIRGALRDLISENRAPAKPYITIQKGDLSIMMSHPDPTTRKMLDCMRENNFRGIMEHMNAVDRIDCSAVVDFCKCLETAVGIMRFIADNTMRKMTLGDYQRGLFDIMQAAGALADSPGSEAGRHDLESGISALLGRLESHAALTDILEEHGETEEELDKRMSASLLKF